jgi:hypothetical protein
MSMLSTMQQYSGLFHSRTMTLMRGLPHMHMPELAA